MSETEDLTDDDKAQVIVQIAAEAIMTEIPKNWGFHLVLFPRGERPGSFHNAANTPDRETFMALVEVSERLTEKIVAKRNN
jgi:hypothetical protein